MNAGIPAKVVRGIVAIAALSGRRAVAIHLPPLRLWTSTKVKPASGTPSQNSIVQSQARKKSNRVDRGANRAAESAEGQAGGCSEVEPDVRALRDHRSACRLSMGTLAGDAPALACSARIYA